MKIGHNEQLNVEAKPKLPEKVDTKDKLITLEPKVEPKQVEVNNFYVYLGISALVCGACYLFLKK